MDLHRIEGRPEWAGVPIAQQNGWQRAAARTGGLCTAGNAFSLLGLLSIPYGLHLAASGQYIGAAAAFAAGRVCDLLDGWAAAATATKSPLGEKIDAGFDKIGTAAAGAGLALLDVVPLPAAAALVGPHVAIAVLAAYAYRAGRQFHPSLVGKFSMAGIWLTIILYTLSPVLQEPVRGAGLLLAAGAAGISCGLGLAALYLYAAELRSTRPGR